MATTYPPTDPTDPTKSTKDTYYSASTTLWNDENQLPVHHPPVKKARWRRCFSGIFVPRKDVFRWLVKTYVFWIVLGAAAVTMTTVFTVRAFRHASTMRAPTPVPGTNQTGPTTQAVWDDRANQVKASFVHAYDGYQKFAFPEDELLPVSNNGTNNFNGWGVTVVDALDTIVLMGLSPQYYQGALTHVQALNITAFKSDLGFFETVIRYMGGFLSAYALTNETVFKDHADQLGQLLLPVFNTSSNLPASGLNASNATPEQSSSNVGVAGMASFQLEFKYLAHITGRKDYYSKARSYLPCVSLGILCSLDLFSKAAGVNQVMRTYQDPSGLLSDYFNTDSGTPQTTRFSVGAGSDSAYEYLLKQYLLTAKSEPSTLDMYLKAVNGIIQNLLYISPTRNLVYVTDISGGTPSNRLEHLSCFLPGLLILGTMTLSGSLSDSDKQMHTWAALGLSETCYITYMDQASGLGPDISTFGPGGIRWVDSLSVWRTNASPGLTPPGVHGGQLRSTSSSRDYNGTAPSYLLRPETIESLFYMYRATGDEIWRQRGWDIYQAIENRTKTDSGYASVSGVDTPNPQKTDSMPSYYLAETLKYLYLLFQGNTSVVPLDKYVFNTEAHPLPVFQWSADEIAQFNISTTST